MRAICGGDNEAAKQELLPSICGGSKIIAVAWQEKPGQLAGEIATRAEKNGDGFLLSGEKDFVHAAPAADGFLSQRAQPAASACSMRLRPRRDLTLRRAGSPTGRHLKAAAVRRGNPVAHVVASPACGEAALDAALEEGSRGVFGGNVGGMRASLDMTLDHLRQRKQFGKAIGSFRRCSTAPSISTRR